MYNFKKIKSWFTLIEVLVSITIFSIIMISIIMIFKAASEVSYKIDLNRSMQENIKNIVESVSKDVTSYGISWVSKHKAASDCDFNYTSWLYRQWDKLCLAGISYYLAEESTDWSWPRVEESEIVSKCSSIWSKCVLVKFDWTDTYRVSNSSVYFRDLRFYLSKDYIPKVTMTFTIQPAARRWVNTSLIENTKINFQTTFSQRLIETK